MTDTVFSGDEAIAQAAIDAGLSGAFAYPGTPSTEIMEYLQLTAASFSAQWCANEKTAYESALGASLVGRRALVSMKHVGLNVAADPFVNSGLLRIKGGLVVVVADDPGMHSSQNEQDSRVLADFARIPCWEPSSQQEAYEMTRAAFDYSEKNETPVLIRITTRLAHARAVVQTSPARGQNPVEKSADKASWTLMPAMSRKRWILLNEKQSVFVADADAASPLSLDDTSLGIITCGLGLPYYLENEADWARAHNGKKPSHLHIGRYPFPPEKVRALAGHVQKLLVIEEGYPFVEKDVRGVFGAPVPVAGKMTGEIPLTGELSPDIVRTALGLPLAQGYAASSLVPPMRPPQFCQGCPHADSFTALKAALADEAEFLVTGDIGCYTLAVLPPWSTIEACVDMGASIGMARGASTVGHKTCVAVIGDSTFYHSGLTNMLDAVAHTTSMTLLILDNGTTGMTGAQKTISPTSRLTPLLEGLGVEKEHIRVLQAHRNKHEENVAVFREELAYQGLSVIVMVRECIEWLKKARKA